MSFEAIVWALEQAPDVPAHCLGTLLGLANHADPSGCGAYAGQKLIADYARKTDRAVRNDLVQLADLKLIREGDQSIAAHIAADSRPVVYDLALERKSASVRNSDSARELASPTRYGRRGEQRGSGSTLPPETAGDGSELPSEAEGTEADFRGERKHTSGGERKPASDKPEDLKNSPTESSSTRRRRDLNADREDVMRLCAHLADRVESNTGERPEIGKKWLDAARLMLDTDHRTEEQIRKAIDWCQSDEFWRDNVLSMPTLRKQYLQLRMKAQAQARRGTNGRAGGHQPYANPDPADYDARY